MLLLISNQVFQKHAKASATPFPYLNVCWILGKHNSRSIKLQLLKICEYFNFPVDSSVINTCESVFTMNGVKLLITMYNLQKSSRIDITINIEFVSTLLWWHPADRDGRVGMALGGSGCQEKEFNCLKGYRASRDSGRK